MTIIVATVSWSSLAPVEHEPSASRSPTAENLRSSAESAAHSVHLVPRRLFRQRPVRRAIETRAARVGFYSRGAVQYFGIERRPQSGHQVAARHARRAGNRRLPGTGPRTGVGVSAALGSTSQRLRLISNSTPQQTAPRGRDSIAQGASPASRSGTEPKAPKGARRECRGCGQWNLALLGLARFIDDCTHGSAARRPELSNLAHFGAGQSRIMKGR